MLKAPFSFFGGKSRVAPIVWRTFGEVDNYVEPFAGSLAVLLGNPKIPKIETVNDIDCMISNFWRAVSNDPEGVAKYADYPVHENELHARHRWLISVINDEFRIKMDTDPYFFDSQIAGYWVWGISASVGNNWLNNKGLKAAPLLSSAGGGIHGLSHNILDWFKALHTRLKRVRVCCGDYKRILTPSITYNNKGISQKSITAVFLDPPYDLKERDKVYKEDKDIFTEVKEWAIDNGNIANLRIALCGYDNIKMPDDWQIYHWKGNGLGNMSNSRGKINLTRETIYFSPNCNKLCLKE